MTAPRIDIDLGKLEDNARTLVGRLATRGIGVTGVTKATLGDAAVGAAMLRGGVVGLGDSRVANLVRLEELDRPLATTLIRTPMLSQVRDVVRYATCSLNTDATVLAALDAAAAHAGCVHDVVLMVELGDLREGIAADEVVAAAEVVRRLPSLRLIGLGANLACQNGVIPDDHNMRVLSDLVAAVETAQSIVLTKVSAGNSANLQWAEQASSVGRVNDLRLGEAILLGRDPLDRRSIEGLHLDAFTLMAEVIEVAQKPAQPWGRQAQAAFGTPPTRTGTSTVRQAILAIGRQDFDAGGLQVPDGMTVLGVSSDHLVLDHGDHDVRVGDEIAFGVDYAALVAAMTSPFVSRRHIGGDSAPSAAEHRVSDAT